MYGSDKDGTFGFASVADWLDSVFASFPSPWSIAPLDGKYYGTEIRDARHVPILSVWESVGEPSAREKESFGGDWTPELWAEYCCSSHWESAKALTLAESIVTARNSCDGPYLEDGMSPLSALIIRYCRWETAVYEDIACGGPLRRRIESPVFSRKA